jgi:hypothetical protein
MLELWMAMSLFYLQQIVMWFKPIRLLSFSPALACQPPRLQPPLPQKSCHLIRRAAVHVNGLLPAKFAYRLNITCVETYLQNMGKDLGQFCRGKWYCDCNPPTLAVLHETYGNTQNKGRFYYKCEWRNIAGKDCNLFLWEDEAQKRQEAMLQKGESSEPLRPGQTRPPRPTQPSPTPTPSHNFRAPDPRAPSQASTVATHIMIKNELEDDDGDVTEDEAENARDDEAEGIAMPVTPRANRMDHIATPGKRKYSQTSLETPKNSGMPPLNAEDSGYFEGESSQRQAKKRVVEPDFSSQRSSQSPTPSGRRNTRVATNENTLFEQITQVLEQHEARLSPRAYSSIQEICNRQ